MQSLLKSSKNNPCPVCSNIKGACRQGKSDPSFILCHTYADAKLNEVVRAEDGSLWVCTKEISGHTASFKPEDSDSKKRTTVGLFKTSEKKTSNRSFFEPLPNEVLDNTYRKVLSELGLSKEHRLHLLSRGYSEEMIKATGFKTLPAWYVPITALPSNFPGQIWVKERTKKVLGRGKDMLLIPLVNDGLICGATIQDLHPNEEKGEGKYLRHSSADFPYHRQNREQPIQVYLPDGNHKRVWLGVEGGAHKAILAHLKFGEPVIAGMGCNLAGSPTLLAEAIAKAKAKYGDDVEFIGIVPDGGAVSNSGVIIAYQKNIKAFEELGLTTVAAWWGQVDKDAKDIDELEDLSAVKFVSNDEFFAIANDAKEVKPEGEITKPASGTLESAQSKIINGSRKTELRQTKDWANWIQKTSCIPDVILKGDGDLELPKDLDIRGRNVIFDSGLGTNKTGASLVYLLMLQQVYGTYTILLSYINSLLHQTGDRGKQIGKEFIHIQSDDDGKQLSKDSRSNVSLCVHSLGYVDGHFSDRNVFVDEIESVLQTLVSGANLGKHHGEILEMFFRGLRNSQGNLFTDGHVTNLTADVLRDMTGKPTTIIKYESTRFRKKNFEFILTLTKKGKIAYNDPSAIIARLLRDIRAGKKTFFTTDSRMLGESVLEKSLAGMTELDVADMVATVEKEGYKTFIISRKTSGTEEGKKFLANPGKYILENKIDLVIGTPSIGSGVSVQLPVDYFDAQYTIFCGVLSTNQQKQLLARLRNNSLTHYVYSPICSVIKDRNRPQRYSAIEFQREYKELIESGRMHTMDDIRQLVIKAESRINPIFDKYSAEMEAIDNFEQDNLLECLTYSVEAEGHNVTLRLENPDDIAKGEIKEAKAKIQLREAEEFEKSEAFESTLEAEKATRSNPTSENHVRKEKTYLLDKLPGIDEKPVWDTEFILKYVIQDRERHTINAIQKEFMLKNFDIASEKFNLRMLNNAQKEHPVGKDLLPGDFATLWALKELKFEERVLNVEQFTCKSPGIQELVEDYKARKDLQKILRVKVPGDGVKDTSIPGLIKPLLGLLGMKTKEVSKVRINGVVQATYKTIPTIEEADRSAIYDCVREKWVKWQEKQELSTKLEATKSQEELTRQAQELAQELREAQSDSSWDASMSRDNLRGDIAYIRDALMDVASAAMSEAVEMFETMKQLYPFVALKAAISTMSAEYADKFANIGAPRMVIGAFDQAIAQGI